VFFSGSLREETVFVVIDNNNNNNFNAIYWFGDTTTGFYNGREPLCSARVYSVVAPLAQWVG
jgi:hypothetical protein